MYQALYRKYRPLMFSDVVGQEGVTRTLTRQIETGHIGHAYLFTGTRGTGKTTCAKIFARAVNCEHPVNGDPCNECPACKGILSGAVTDVYEIDAASNNSVGDVRDLREDVIYTPATVKYKVYIIDEVHRMSGSAFDALLKTIEEPPAHVIFILATTELHKVPATILSRCQRYDFRRIDTADIAARLSYVAGQEQMTLTTDAARLLARMGQGSMRDALSLLERAGALQGEVNAAAVGELLGLCDPERMLSAVESIAEGDTAAVMEFLDEMWRSSKDIGRLLSELAVLLRNILLSGTAPALLESTHTPEEIQKMNELLNQMGNARIMACMEMLQNGIRDMGKTADSRVMTEITLMRLCDSRLATTNDALLARIEALETQGVTVVQKAPPAPKKPKAVSEEIPLPEAPPEPTAPTQSTAPVSPVKNVWPKAIEILKTSGRHDLAATLSGISPKIEGTVVTFELESGFTRNLLATENNKSAITDALKKTDGRDYAIRFSDPASKQPERDALDDLIDTLSESDKF